MENKKISIIWNPKAEKSLQSIYNFIAQDSIVNAGKFIAKLIAFGDSLGFMPDKFQVCRQQRFAKYNYRCAVFANNYIFVYKIVKHSVVIYAVLHVSRLS